MLEQLTAYVLSALLLWAPIHGTNRGDASPEDTHARYESIAADIATVVDDEAPVFRDDVGHARTAVLLATVAFFESGFQRYVDRGLCNDPVWTASPEGRRTMASGGDCDGGRQGYAQAASMWQVHAEEGVVLLESGGWSRAFNFSAAWRAEHAADIVGVRELAADRRVAARVALHMLRQSVERGGALCAYTGELGPCPKASARLGFAERWSRAHPFAAADDEAAD